MSENKINLIKREEWGALPAKEPTPEYVLPIIHVIFTLITPFGECKTKEECVDKVRRIQKLHMDEGLPDIAYNFLLGDDGNVYEGRGWFLKGAKAIGDPKFDGKTLDIAAIGDFSDEIPDDVYDLSIAFLKHGIEMKYLDKDYTFVGHGIEDLYDTIKRFMQLSGLKNCTWVDAVLEDGGIYEIKHYLHQ